MKEDILEEELKTQYRNGDFAIICDGCGKKIPDNKEVHEFGGLLCNDCYNDVEKNL